MSAPAAMQGDYVDLRFVKGRKVCQIVIELPIEAGAQFVAAFGTPDPSTTIPVAIARIDTAPTTERKAGGKLAQRAGIICGEGAFKKFIQSEFNASSDCDPAQFLRNYCGVKSRSELDHDRHSSDIFRSLELHYITWLQAVE